MVLKIVKHNFIYIVFSCFYLVQAQSQTTLSHYIEQGLESNLSLQQKQLNYQKSLYALKESKGMFFPNISLEARYTVANGGRNIDLPVRDLFEGFADYNNHINNSSLLVPDQIQNEAVPFLRPQEHETKLRLVQPVFNSDIYFNYQIKKDVVTIKNVDIHVYKRHLISEIKVAYFSYLKTLALQNLVSESEMLVQENLRVNQKLFENDKITIDNIYQAKAEISKVAKKKAEVKKLSKTSQAYFNFLVNKPMESNIDIDSFYFSGIEQIPLDSNINHALKNRAEIQMLETQIDVTNKMTKMNKSARLPNIFTVIDYGYQGAEYNFNNENDFIMASVMLSWDLFKGSQNKAKIQQAKINTSIAQKQLDEAKAQIELQVISSYYELEEAIEAFNAAIKEFESSGAAFRIIEKKYLAGQAGFLEYTNARLEKETSAENKIISQYEIYIKQAQLELMMASYNFPQN